MSINLTSILFWCINQWFWFSIFASAYIVGIFIFYNDNISINSLVLSGNSKKDAIEKHNYVKKNMTWDIVLLDICSYLPFLIMCWLPIYHFFFFLSINELAFGVDIDYIEKEREKNKQEIQLKKEKLNNKKLEIKLEIIDLLNEISTELAKQKKEEDFIKENIKNDSTNKNIDYLSKKKINSELFESENSKTELSKSKKDDDWDNYTEL